MEDEGDVFEMVDEDEYANIVERRRNEDEFVVDDSKWKFFTYKIDSCLECVFKNELFSDGHGYHDDGEEHLGIGEDAHDGKWREQ